MVNSRTLKAMLSYHEAQVESWKDYFSATKDWSWGREAYAFHQNRVEELSGLLKKAEAGERRKTKVSVLSSKVRKHR